MAITAAELLARLAKDEEFQARKKAKEEKFAKLKELYEADEKSLIEELSQAGFSVSSAWDFVNSSNYYLKAEPILVKHLKIPHHPRVLSGIVRSLAVPEFSENDELWDLLVELYIETPSDSDVDIPEHRGLQEAIAVALRRLATPKRVGDLKRLVAIKANGDCIDWLQSKLNQFS